LTGFSLSGKLHIGQSLVIKSINWLASLGNSECHFILADLESYLIRGIPLEEARKLAEEDVLPNAIALGLAPEKCRIYLQSREKNVQRLAITLSKRVTFNELRAIYGFDPDQTSTGKIFYPLINAADILHVQLDEYGGKKPTIVPVGADQDPHIRLTRDLAKREGFVKPSSIYFKLRKGLLGEKMSKSKPEAAIFLSDTPEMARKKIWNAFTGGRPTAKEQRELGGNPDICSVYEAFVYDLIEDDEKLLEIREKCVRGEIICGDCKELAGDLLEKLLEDLACKREEAKEIAKQLLSE